MPISKRCEHGLKAAVQLAIRFDEGYIQARELAKSEGLPAKFIEAVLLQMRLAGLLESKVGAGGGYRLTRPPSEILVSDLLDIFCADLIFSEDGKNVTMSCANETPGTQAVTTVTGSLRAAMRSAVEGTTLQQLMEQTQIKPDEISETNEPSEPIQTPQPPLI